MSAICNLNSDLILCRTKWNGYVVVPGYNVDVAPGILRDGIIEPWTTRLVQEFLKRGDTYLNIGANFGYYTVLGASIVGKEGKVISIEANPHVFSILMKTIMWSGYVDRIQAYNRACYQNSNEELDFTFDFQYIGGGHIKHPTEIDMVDAEQSLWEAGSIPKLIDHNGKWNSSLGLMNSFKIKTTSLDDIESLSDVDLIQCDVESAEPFVILGAKQLLSSSPKCKIIFEWSGYAFKNGNSEYRLCCEKMWEIFCSIGYVVRQLIPMVHADGGIEVSPILSWEEFIDGTHGDYVAVRSDIDPFSKK